MPANSIARRRPASAQEILDGRSEFSRRLAEAKSEPLPLDLTWYPYDSMASIDHMAPFFRKHFDDFSRAFESGPVIDFGCGDGDIPLFFASLGCEVAAADNPVSNHNWMAGVRALRERMNLRWPCMNWMRIMRRSCRAGITGWRSRWGFCIT
jgi:hypothetical protein